MQYFDQNCSKLFQGCYPRIPLGGRGHPLPHRSPSQPKLSNPNILDARPPLRADTTSRRRPSLALSTRRQTHTPLLVPRRPHTVSPYSYIPLHGPDRTRPDFFCGPGLNSVGSVRVSDKVRAGPRGPGRACVVEFSL